MTIDETGVDETGVDELGINRMSDKLTAEKEIPGLNVTEQDMGNNKLFSRRCLQQCSM